MPGSARMPSWWSTRTPRGSPRGRRPGRSRPGSNAATPCSRSSCRSTMGGWNRCPSCWPTRCTGRTARWTTRQPSSRSPPGRPPRNSSSPPRRRTPSADLMVTGALA
ncbi:hypothetical protein ACFFX0_22030 [Citricoccus parietis]|uniref:Uncharacterized protein n=1 Tax=Citricoccus parietis TaxID=592307 RepID=A0ABV5G499_9MICC